MAQRLHQFAHALRELLGSGTADEAEAIWARRGIDEMGWAALARAECSTNPAAIPVLDETDGLLLRLRDRLPMLAEGPAGEHLQTFRMPQIERLQHATAAALVAHRFGTAGLATIASDVRAPLGRRYHAFLLLARFHAGVSWPLFRRYLTAEAHHAFVGVAAEASRFYPERSPAAELVSLFQTIRADLHLRAFLAPRLLQSLFVLHDPVATPLYEELVVSGHTSPDPTLCEVTHALVMLRSLTGAVPPNAKFDDGTDVHGRLNRAASAYRANRSRLRPVTVL